jgi:D-inositol-3-phosphate glycosyltransferase
MRPVIIICLDSGGIMHYGVDLANAISYKGIETTFIGYSAANRFLNSSNVHFINWNGYKYISLQWKLITAIITNRKAVIHFSNYHPCFILPALIARLLNIKIFLTIHDIRTHSVNNIRYRLINLLLLRYALFLLVKSKIFLSYYIADLSPKWIRKKYCVIPLAQDVRRYGKVEYTSRMGKNAIHPLRLLFFGHVDLYKGIDIFENAYRDILMKDIPLEGCVAGKQVINITSLSKLPGIVVRTGFIAEDDIVGLFDWADVVILPYREVSQSGVLPLSLSFGVPVIASNIGSFKEYIVDYENGLLFQSESWVSLSSKILLLAQQPELLTTMKEGAKKYSRTILNWDILANAYLKFYGYDILEGVLKP